MMPSLFQPKIQPKFQAAFFHLREFGNSVECSAKVLPSSNMYGAPHADLFSVIIERKDGKLAVVTRGDEAEALTRAVNEGHLDSVAFQLPRLLLDMLGSGKARIQSIEVMGEEGWIPQPEPATSGQKILKELGRYLENSYKTAFERGEVYIRRAKNQYEADEVGIYSQEPPLPESLRWNPQ